MQTINRKIGDFDDLLFECDLSAYGKTNLDIEDIVFSVKKDEKSADDSIFLKKYSLNEISFSGTNILSILVQWDYNEYTKVSVGQKYKAGLFIKFIGDPIVDEHVDQIFNLEILQDFLRI